MKLASLTGVLVLATGVLVIAVLAPNWQKQGVRKQVQREADRRVATRVREAKVASAQAQQSRPVTLAELASVAFSLRVQRAVSGLFAVAMIATGLFATSNLPGLLWLICVAVIGLTLTILRYRVVNVRLGQVLNEISVQRARLVRSRLPKTAMPAQPAPVEQPPTPSRSWMPVELPAPRQLNGTLESPVLAKVAQLPSSPARPEVVADIDEILRRRRNAG